MTGEKLSTFIHGQAVYYILDGHEVVPCEDILDWAKWTDDAYRTDPSPRIVARTAVGDSIVSTVFLGIDHNWAFTGEPVLFETMVFDKDVKSDSGCWRCSTWEEAEAQHKMVVEQLTA